MLVIYIVYSGAQLDMATVSTFDGLFMIDNPSFINSEPLLYIRNESRKKVHDQEWWF